MQDELKETARTYYDQGNNIVTVNAKKEALVKWAKWVNKRQTKEEFESLAWPQADGFCVVCGWKLNNGMYIGAVDLDVKNTTQEVIDRGSELEKNLRVTHTEETVSGGKHYIYYSRKPIRKVKDAKKIHDFCGCEILGEKKLCVMAPSASGKYRRLNDNPATGIESLNVLFETALEKIGYKLARAHKKHTRSERTTEVRPCILGLLEKTHLSHLEKVAVVTEHKFSGMKQEEIEGLFRKHNAWEGTDYDTEKTRYQINHIIEGKYKRFGQENLESMGLCSENCQLKENCMRRHGNFESEKGIFNPVLFAKHLLENFYFKTPRETETLFVFNWNKGIYDPMGEIFVKEQMVRDLDEDTRQHHLADVLFFIKGATYFDVGHNPLGKIAVENGILDVTTNEVIEYTPELFIETRIPIKHDPNTKCPKILKFLIEVVGKEQISTIQEIIGYCLYKALPYHKSILLIGDGENGKSTLLHLIEKFLGADNVSHSTLQALCTNRFQTAELYEKLANICDDLPSTALKQTSMFKMLTGGYKVEAQKKFKNPFDFHNYAKLIFSANEIPETEEDTRAFWRRWITIACNNIFSGKNCDPKILEKISTPEELSGLLNWALEGLKRLIERGMFSINKTIDAIREQWVRGSNSAKAFVEENLTYDPDPKTIIPTVDLYEAYILFCKTNSIPTKPKRVLTLNIQEILPQARKSTQRYKGKATKVWQFLKIVKNNSVTFSQDTEQPNLVTFVTTSPLIHKNNIKNNTKKVTQQKNDLLTINRKTVTKVTDQPKNIAQICPLCALGLPMDGFDTTIWKGQVVHRVCYLKATQEEDHY